MYNNEVTYNDKWDTPENKAALEKLERKYFDNSQCAPDCPVAWAPEVLELFDTIQRELGFIYNTDTIRGYRIQGNAIEWFLCRPWRELFSAYKRNFFTLTPPKHWSWEDKSRRQKTKWERVKAVAAAFVEPIKYGFSALTVQYLNPIRNKIYRPKVSLGQLKEKYGELTIYFNAPDAFEEWIDRQIRRTEIKIAMKGAYWPVESFYSASRGYSVGTKYKPDTITATPTVGHDGKEFISVSETTYRGTMVELGLDLDDIKAKYDAMMAAKEAEKKAKSGTP